VPVHLPGRQARLREAPLTRVEDVADVLAELLAVHTGPVAVYGHSLGGTIAYELAMRLQEGGRPPRALVLVRQPPFEIVAGGRAVKGRAGLDWTWAWVAIAWEESRRLGAPGTRRPSSRCC
jgi:surfactin synthase thioesterase subunit